MSEKEKFLASVQAKVKRGLVSMDFFPTDAIVGANEEDVYAELNRMNAAPDLPDPEVLGNRSLS